MNSVVVITEVFEYYSSYLEHAFAYNLIHENFRQGKIFHLLGGRLAWLHDHQWVISRGPASPRWKTARPLATPLPKGDCSMDNPPPWASSQETAVVKPGVRCAPWNGPFATVTNNSIPFIGTKEERRRTVSCGLTHQNLTSSFVSIIP